MRPLKPMLLLGCGLLTGLLFLQQPARAVGLGAVQVHSRLNQPLDVTIPLLSVADGELAQIQVGLGSAEDFARIGLERSLLLAGLDFAVDREGARPVIRVTSEEPIREPFLGLLVRLEWPQGRLLREYTVLLDPPLTAPATAPEPARGEVAEAPAPEPIRRTAPEPTPEITTPSAAGGEYGPVAAGETLWSIASATRPQGVSVNQMMLALLRTNPEAFYQQNVNALKRGAVLRIPARDEIDRLTVADALAQVQRQHALWQDYRLRQAQTTPAVVAGGEPAPREAVADEAPEEAARLELVPPREPEEAVAADTAVAGTGTAAREAEIAALRDELARTQEALLARREQTGQLDSRVIELERQVADLQRLLELKNNELAALQSQAAGDETPIADTQAPATAGAAAELAGEPDPFAEEAPLPLFGAPESVPGETGVEAEPGLAPGQGAAPDTGAPAEQSADAVSPAAPAAEPGAGQAAQPVAAAGEPPPERRGWLGRVLSPVAVGIYGLILIGVGVALFLHRRRAEEDLAYVGHTTAERQAVGYEEPAEKAPSEVAPPAEEAPPDDVTALRAALDEDPADTRLRLQLLAHHAANGERDAFVAEAETLYAQLADPADPTWQEARRMGEALAPEHPLFGGEEDLLQTATEELPQVEDESALAGTETPTGSAAEERLEEATEQEASVADREYDLADLVDEPAEPEATLPPATEPEQPMSEYELTEPDLTSEARQGFEPETADELPDQAMLGDEDAASTKLELAEAYLEMGDHEGAKGMLDEVLQDGNAEQQEKARELLQRLN